MHSEHPDARRIERDYATRGHSLARLAHSLMLDEGLAEDVVQDVWVTCLRRREVEVRNRGAWQHAVLRYLALRKRSSRGRRLDLERRAARAEALPPADAELLRRETRDHLEGAVAALGEPYASVVHLRFFEGLLLREIAGRLGRPEGTVKVHLHRGLARLRGRLGRSAGQLHLDRRGPLPSTLIHAVE